MKLADRITALEAELVADADDLEAVVVRTTCARAGGRLYVDADIVALRSSDGALVPRLPGESLQDLAQRAAAAVQRLHPRARPILLAVYALAPARDAA